MMNHLKVQGATGKSKQLAGGYLVDVLKPVAHDIARRLKKDPPEVRVDRPKRAEGPPPKAPAERPAESRVKVDRSKDGLRLELPATGSTKSSRGMLIFGIIFTVICTGIPGAMWWFVLSSEKMWESLYGTFLGVMSVYLVPIGLVGPGCIISAIAQRRRRGVVEVAGGKLVIRQKGILGRVDSWDAPEIASIRCGPSGTRINEHEIMELEIHLEDGREVGRLAGRDEAELGWLASVLWRELKGAGEKVVREAGPPSSPPGSDFGGAGGECQVCGAGMTEGVVYCAACGTAHHEDCWTYLGKCSTYGCSETRFAKQG